MKKVLILGSSKGIGKAIKNQLKNNYDLVLPNSKILDTSKIETIKKFISKEKNFDILILNTGGPPAKDFFSISESEWIMYFNQLFLGFVTLLKNIKVNKNGYIFLISSHTIKSPEYNLVISNSLLITSIKILALCVLIFISSVILSIEPP